MTRAMQAVSAGSSKERWLRWALVRDGRIERESVVSPERGVTIGAGGDVAADHPCRALAFFEGGWTLSVAPSWRGRIGGQRIEELARGAKDWQPITLREGDHVRIELGSGAAILVQLVDRPARRQVPALPASVRGGILQRADWWFTAFVTGSLLLHFAFVVGLLEADWPVQQALLPDRVADIIFEPAPEPDPARVPEEAMANNSEPTTRDDADPSDALPNTEHARSSRPHRRTSSSSPQPSVAEVQHAIEVAQLQLGAVLGQNGSMQNLLAHGASTPDQESVVASAESMQASNEDPGALRERDSSIDCASCNGGRDLGRLAASGRGNREVGEGEPMDERIIRVHPDPTVPILPDPPPGFDPRELTRALRGRIRAAQRCYEHELTQGNPDTEGRLTMSLTIMPVGTLSNVHAAENTTGSIALAACVSRTLATVRVRSGPDEPVELEYAMVFQHPG